MQVHVGVPSPRPSNKRRKFHETLFLAQCLLPVSHIALLEVGLPYELVKVDIRAKKLENGENYLKLNPKRQVPALGLDSGEIVTEGPVIVQMIADQASAKALAHGSSERYKLLEWLSFLTSEVHKSSAQLFAPTLNDDAARPQVQAALKKEGLI